MQCALNSDGVGVRFLAVHSFLVPDIISTELHGLSGRGRIEDRIYDALGFNRPLLALDSKVRIRIVPVRSRFLDNGLLYVIWDRAVMNHV